MDNDIKDRLLSAWDNRPSAYFVPDAGKRVQIEISILESLRTRGCDKTRDGLSIKVQLDERMALICDVSKIKKQQVK